MNSSWDNFKQTGAITDYLNYINSTKQAMEEESDAANNDGDSSARGENW